MSSTWGSNFKISLFGESHGKGIGVTIDGIPAGVPINNDKIKQMMSRRMPGTNKYSTKRKEPDEVEILSGIYKGYTTGTPIGAIILNTDTHSKDYAEMPLRPSHADYTGLVRYAGYNDPRGGGHFSARLTAPLVFAGAVAKQILEAKNIIVGGAIKQIYTAHDNPPSTLTKNILSEIANKTFPVFDDIQGEKMQAEIETARLAQDSVGGIVSCFVLGFPTGIGSPIFDGLENKISSIIFGIPAVRGIEFGTGFEAAEMKGSQHNDPFILNADKKITTSTNHHGGIIGGISSGMPIYFNVAFKPTPSISSPQNTIDIDTKEKVTLEIKGRHDPCVVPRAVPCVEAATAIALVDALLEGGNSNVTW